MTHGSARHPAPAESAEVVVVGGGAAGLVAAIEAADQGARVLLLQKLPEPGGKSALAIGSISAAGTSLQRSRGIDDDHAQHRRDLRARIDRGGIEPLAMDKLDQVLEHGPAAVEWLLELGVTMSGPHPELATERWRMHVITPDVRSLVSVLAQQARRRGVRIRGDWAVQGLVTDDAGRVIGVSGPGGVVVLADSHVVLATGDWSSPAVLGATGPVGSEFAFRPWSSGDGHHLARTVGGELTHLDRPLKLQLRSIDWPHIEPQAALLAAGGILVDRTGRRVTNELDDPAAHIAHGADEDVYLVLDDRVVRRIATAADDSPHARDGWLTQDKLYVATFPGVAYAYVDDVVQAGYGALGDTPGELAAGLRIDPDGLARTLAQYNTAVAAGAPDELGRAERQPVDRAPYFGIGPMTCRAILGRAGIRTDGQARVLRADGTPVAGLLAAGAAAGVTGFAYGHGYELAWAVVSGRIAGRTAAAPTTEPDLDPTPTELANT
ncbi:MAG TPA: FAD-dependent oxidoreductase [Mycobacteriales bacterium]|nr:FAD-dependent oxidoreductase [Mycobacteriales bacterium]